MKTLIELENEIEAQNLRIAGLAKETGMDKIWEQKDVERQLDPVAGILNVCALTYTWWINAQIEGDESAARMYKDMFDRALTDYQIIQIVGDL
jgi:hypothetical protein